MENAKQIDSGKSETSTKSLITWRSVVAIVTPVLLSPLLWSTESTQQWKCAFVVLLMAIYWSTEPLPVAVTALFPVFLLPILGLVTTDEACKPYLQEPNMVFVGSLIFAVAVEQSGLHRRCALLILKTVGGNFDSIALGFMLTTMAIAMWIINTAAAAMMVSQCLYSLSHDTLASIFKCSTCIVMCPLNFH